MIRKATQFDTEGVWRIFREVIKSGDTYVYDPRTPKNKIQQYWFADHMHTFVYEKEGKILGTYILKPNQLDLGSHIANASYMVLPAAHGQGIGKLLCEHSIQTAKGLGFIAMQFNIVVAANKGAIHLWKKFGFKIIGTIPKAYNHLKLGLIDAHIMYKSLQND